jgi:FkbM family methyltransferase
VSARPGQKAVPAKRPGRLAVARFVARHRDHFLLERGAWLARRYLVHYGNQNYDPRSNGEARVLRAMGGLGAWRLFDVGAHTGEWTALALSCVPGAEVHAFEVVPDLAARSAERFADLQAVTINAVGLGDRTADVEVRFFPGTPALSSLHDLPHEAPSEIRVGRTIAGDVYCEAHAIDRIDLLKIDVEGHELSVLRGFDRLLSAGVVRAVQFEYGWASIYTKSLLNDLYGYFAERGYVVGKIFPRTVRFRPYGVLDEDFLGPNYLAVREGDNDLRAALA